MSQLGSLSRRSSSPGWALDIAIGALALTVVMSVLLGLFQLPLSAASFSEPVGSSTAAVRLPVARIPEDDTLQVMVGGTPQPLAASGEIPIGGGIFGRIVATHSNDRRLLRNLDVYLYQNPNAASPVVGASVQAAAHMRGMPDMGTVRQVGTSSGGGHYLVTLNFPMTGEWQIDLVVTAATEHPMVALVLYIWT